MVQGYIFTKAFERAVITVQPSWGEVINLPQAKRLQQRDIIDTINNSYGRLITGRNKKLFKYRDLIQGYIDQFSVERLPEHMRRNIKMLLSANVDRELVNTIIADTQKLVDTNKKN